MFIGKQYCEAIAEINNLKQRGFSNFYTERMLAYSYLECTTETDAFKKGIEASDKFFAIAPKEKITYLDYKNKGALYSKSGSDSLAIVEYENASKLSEVAAKDLAGDLAKLYSKAKKYDKAIEAYNFKATLNKLSPAEEYDLGKCYYFGPKSYSLADSAFARVAKLSPNYAPAYLWRARSSFQLDPKNEKWLCQPFYEKVIEIVKVEDRGTPSNKAMVMESAKYLGDYYVRSEAKDLVKAKTFWEIVIALDPADAQAKAFLGLK
jgi:tetratricopeptide (TPR) repeat protein